MVKIPYIVVEHIKFLEMCVEFIYTVYRFAQTMLMRKLYPVTPGFCGLGFFGI